jgi:hypothetical protein
LPSLSWVGFFSYEVNKIGADLPDLDEAVIMFHLKSIHIINSFPGLPA